MAFVFTSRVSRPCAHLRIVQPLSRSAYRTQSTLSSQPAHVAAQLDFRTFVDVLRADGDLAEINKQVDPHLEVGAIVRRHKILGDDIDLHKLPAPKLHQGDAGKGMIHDSRRLVCLVGSGQHNSVIRDMWLKKGKTEVSWALAFGVPPAASVVAACPIPPGISEAEYVGAMVGQPLDVVKCELSDLLVPANSEIVMEDTSVPGKITDESHVTASMASEELLQLLRQHGFPVIDAFASLETYATWCALKVDVKKLAELRTTSKEFCNKIGNLVFNDKSAMLMNRIMLFGHDVNVRDFKDIMWALATCCRPGQDEHLFEDIPVLPLTPYMSHGRGNPTRGGKVVSDCLFPMEYEGKTSFRGCEFERSYPEEVKERVRSNWTAMGFVEVESPSKST
ncbi:hypothetical protein MY4038_009299 [Beauveria bassiana]